MRKENRDVYVRALLQPYRIFFFLFHLSILSHLFRAGGSSRPAGPLEGGCCTISRLPRLPRLSQAKGHDTTWAGIRGRGTLALPRDKCSEPSLRARVPALSCCSEGELFRQRRSKLGLLQPLRRQELLKPSFSPARASFLNCYSLSARAWCFN